jgi:hypothetical protein
MFCNHDFDQGGCSICQDQRDRNDEIRARNESRRDDDVRPAAVDRRSDARRNYDADKLWRAINNDEVPADDVVRHMKHEYRFVAEAASRAIDRIIDRSRSARELASLRDLLKAAGDVRAERAERSREFYAWCP